MVIIPFTCPVGKIFTTYEHRVPLTGTGPFSVGEYFLPVGWTANIVGTTLVFSGYADEVFSSFDASFEVFSCCDCDPVTLTTSIVIASGCTYSWSMIPTIATVGVPIKTTFTPPKTCPPDTVLRLAVFRADGVTPYIETAYSAEPLVIAIPAGSSTYVVQPTDAGADIVFKPATDQSACLATCTPSNATQRRIVPPRTDCNITWTLLNRVFEATVSANQTYTVTGLPKGGQIGFDFYIGDVLQSYNDFVLSYDNPTVTYKNLWPPVAIGGDFNFRPRTPLLDTAVGCRVLPARIDVDVVASVVIAPPPAAACAITWSLLNTTFVAGVPKAQKYTAVGLRPGATLTLQFYDNELLQTYSQATCTYENPVFDVGLLTFPSPAIGRNYSYRPLLPVAGTGAGCTVTPSIIPLTITATATGACGGLFTATAAGCVTAAAPPPSSGSVMCSALGVCTVNPAVGATAAYTTTILRANNLPVGSVTLVERSTDSGATWVTDTTGTSTDSSSQIVSYINSYTSTACPSFTSSGGVFTSITTPANRYRVKVGGVVLPSCI